MRVVVFDSHRYDRESLERANAGLGLELVFLEARLNAQTCVLARGAGAVCVFVNDRVDAGVLETLSGLGVGLVALRCAGFNNVDLDAARRLGMAVVRVPEYSPYAVAEHAVALLLALNRKLLRAHRRVLEGNFSLDGLVGFDVHGKTVGVLGTGKIGAAFARIMHGFGCEVVAYDAHEDALLKRDAGVRYLSLDEVLACSDVISLHVPLNAGTRHLMNAEAFAKMKPGAMLLNTGRGALIDTAALVEALKSGRVGAAGLDVYEEEEGLFFEDHSGEVLQDEQLAWLLMCPNVLVTSHQAFLTREALSNIACTTLRNVSRLKALRDGVGGAEALEADGREVLVGWAGAGAISRGT
ncbi:MAG: hypothetical protein RLZZ244_2122 [Verrucomicrobiota bacterium]|jgi:D-lactate dehydrogenase